MKKLSIYLRIESLGSKIYYCKMRTRQNTIC